jgi:hypothetical protein
MYEVYIKTGEVSLGGTDSNVFIQLFGEQAHTDALHLPPEDVFAFEQGNIDKFMIDAPSLGPLVRCCIGQDATSDSGWFVETVRIREQASGREWTFAFQRWLGIEEGGALSACLDV